MNLDQAALIDRGLRRLQLYIESRFVEGLTLQPVAIPRDCAALAGTFENSELILRTQRYRGACFASLTVATLAVAERLCSLTVIGLPHAGASWPVLGMDLIALRGQLSLLAIDLAPTDPTFWETHCSSILADLVNRASDSIVLRKRPEFAAESFSRLALIGAGMRGQESRIFTAIEQFLQDTLRLAQTDAKAKDVGAALERRARWLQSEQRNRKEHNALARMFGEAVAARYLDDFLFGAAAGAGT